MIWLDASVVIDFILLVFNVCDVITPQFIHAPESELNFVSHQVKYQININEFDLLGYQAVETIQYYQ